MIIQAFYNGVTQSVGSTIDAAVRGPLMSKIEDKAHSLIKEMTCNNFQFFTERTQPKRVVDKYEVDAITLLFTKVDAMTHRLDQMKLIL